MSSHAEKKKSGIFNTLKKNLGIKNKDKEKPKKPETSSTQTSSNNYRASQTITTSSQKTETRSPRPSPTSQAIETTPISSNQPTEEEQTVWEDFRIICRAEAICEYHPGDTNMYEEIRFLQFDRGAIIDVLEQDESGWWEGILDGIIGVFPGSYVKVIEVYDTTPTTNSQETQTTPETPTQQQQQQTQQQQQIQTQQQQQNQQNQQQQQQQQNNNNNNNNNNNKTTKLFKTLNKRLKLKKRLKLLQPKKNKLKRSHYPRIRKQVQTPPLRLKSRLFKPNLNKRKNN
jgi:hypothetical protein